MLYKYLYGVKENVTRKHQVPAAKAVCENQAEQQEQQEQSPSLQHVFSTNQQIQSWYNNLAEL